MCPVIYCVSYVCWHNTVGRLIFKDIKFQGLLKICFKKYFVKVLVMSKQEAIEIDGLMILRINNYFRGSVYVKVLEICILDS